MIKQKSTNILSLPNEILLKIFKNLNNLRSTALVCKRFYSLTSALNEDSFEIKLTTEFDINPNFNLDTLLRKASKIELCNLPPRTPSSTRKLKAFLETHGKRVSELTLWGGSDLCSIKNLLLMPKLACLTLHGPPLKIPRLFGVAPHSIQLKTLKVDNVTNSIRLVSFFEVLDVQELDLMYVEPIEKYASLIRGNKNLKKLRLGCKISDTLDMLKAVTNVQIEELDINLEDLEEKKVEKLLENKKNLKVLHARNVTETAIPNICENLVNLETLHVRSSFNKSSLFKIENLTKLKSLDLMLYTRNIDELNVEYLKALCELSMPSVESLSLNAGTGITGEIAEALKVAFPNLKALDIEERCKTGYHEALFVIFKHFNHVEKLRFVVKRIKGHAPDKEWRNLFFTTSHENLQLKSLDISGCCYNKQRLLRKIVRDFPNLDVYPVCFNQELLLKEAKKQPAVEVSVGFLDNSGRKLVGCSVTFVRGGFVEIVKDGKKEVNNFLPQWYFGWQHVQTMLETLRNPQNLHINPQRHLKEEKILPYIKKVGQHVKKLTLESNVTTNLLRSIIEELPHLETIFFKQLNLRQSQEESVEIKNQNIKAIVVTYEITDRQMTLAKFCEDELLKLFKHFSLPEDTLECFQLNITQQRMLNFSGFDQAFIGDKILAKQSKLLENRENWTIVKSLEAYKFVAKSKGFRKIIK